MDPVTIALLAGKGLLGAYQSWQSNLMQVEQPTYQVPGAVLEAEAAARQRAQQTVAPGYEQRTADIDQVATQSLGQVQKFAGTAGQVLGAAQRSNILRNRALRQESILGMQYRDQAMREHLSALQAKGAQQEKAFNINKLMPYQQAYETKSALTNAGITNISSGLSDIAAYREMEKGNIMSDDRGVGTWGPSSPRPTIG